MESPARSRSQSVERSSSLAKEIKKKRPFDLPEQEASLNLERTATILAAQFEQLFKRHGISPAKYNVLRILRGAKLTDGIEGLPSLEIGSRLVARLPDITRLVDGLEDDGLVTRRRCTEDRRIVYVAITEKGLRLLAELDSPTVELHKKQLGHLTRAELAELNRLLVKARTPEA
jgi:DNA-binding MarR family transcriptional regulator